MIVYSGGMEQEWKNSSRFGFERVPSHMKDFNVDSWGNVYMLDHLYTPPYPISWA